MKRVLIVDDEVLIAIDIETVVNQSGLGGTTVCTSLEEALDALARERFDLAVVDANLGGESAAPIAATLMAQGIPFIALSGYAHDQLPEEFRQAPFLTKPFTPERLMEEIRSLIHE